MEDKKPALTNEQKLRIAVAHRDYVRADAAQSLAQLRAQTALDRLSQIVDTVGLELGVEKGKYDLSIETFELTEKK
jgi:hypothetical protein